MSELISNETIEKKYKVIKSREEYQELLNHIAETPYQAFDVETTGLNVRKDTVIGYSISGKPGVAYYVPLYYWDVDSQQLIRIHNSFDESKAILAIKDFLTWNGSFDIRVTKHNLKLDILDQLGADVMLMKHTVQEEGPFKLKDTAIERQKDLGLDVEKMANEEQLELHANILKNGGSISKSNYELYKADTDIIGKYACADADLTIRLFELYYEEIEQQGLWDFFFVDEVMPLYKEVTIPMEDVGVRLDMPLLHKLDSEIQEYIDRYRASTLEAMKLEPEFSKWAQSFALSKYPAKSGGNFAKKLAEVYSLPLKVSKSGSPSFSKASIDYAESQGAPADIIRFFRDKEASLPAHIHKAVSLAMLHEDTNGEYISLNSKDQLSQLCFDFLGVQPKGKRGKSGRFSFTEETVEEIAKEYGFEWATNLRIYNKLAIKIKPTYIDRFIQNSEDGYYYFNYKQHGTISGRYGSDAQQIPRPMEEGEDHPDIIKFVNQLRKVFIAREGTAFVDDDYESLEPHVFADVSGDEGLRDIFRKGHDFYSSIAIPTEGLTGVSADKKASNYLGKLDKPKRQSAKAYALGVPYGMTDYALGKSLDIPTEDASLKIEGYLGGFPALSWWMEDSKHQAQTLGYVKTKTGRIRHLPKVKAIHKMYGEDLLDFRKRNAMKKRLTPKMGKEGADKYITGLYLDYKNGINNSRNFQIQGLAGSIVNRAMIAVVREFKKRGIRGYAIAQVHDQAIFEVELTRIEEACKIVQDKMENTTKLSIKLKAVPSVAYNWADGH